MIQSINNFLSALPNFVHIFIISAMPVIELRGAIPYGALLLQMNVYEVFFLSVLGSLVPAPILLFGGKFIFDKLENSKYDALATFITRLKARSIKKGEKIVKYTYLGLMLFIAIPLPGTGVWTGCIVAALLRLNPIKALLSAFAGTTIAGIIVSFLVATGTMLVSI